MRVAADPSLFSWGCHVAFSLLTQVLATELCGWRLLHRWAQLGFCCSEICSYFFLLKWCFPRPMKNKLGGWDGFFFSWSIHFHESWTPKMSCEALAGCLPRSGSCLEPAVAQDGLIRHALDTHIIPDNPLQHWAGNPPFPPQNQPQCRFLCEDSLCGSHLCGLLRTFVYIW